MAERKAGSRQSCVMLGAEKASPDREEVFIFKPTALLSGVS